MDNKKTWYPNGFRRLPVPEFPPGVGVPGKPITPQQFYTEDVFYMFVPDDGLGPRPARRVVSAQPAGPLPPDVWGQKYDPSFTRPPNPHSDDATVIHPDNLNTAPCPPFDQRREDRIHAMETVIAE